MKEVSIRSDMVINPFLNKRARSNILIMVKVMVRKLDFVIREINTLDLEKGFFDTLYNLSVVGNISNEIKRGTKLFGDIKSNPLYKIFVAIKDNKEVIGSITILMEQKFIHNGGRVGHIEDVVTRKGYESKGVGSALVRVALEYAQRMKCYKVILSCSEKNVPFYERIGFKKHETSMRYDLNET
ncbi:MAG: GNAT family N-acetyltransferase [Nitrososphaerales archaeon]